MTGGAGYDVVKPLPHTTKVTLQFDAFFERSRADIGTIDRDDSGLDGVSVSKAAELEAAGYMDVVAVDAVQPSSVSAIYSAPGLDREVFLAAGDLHWDGVELLTMALAPEIESTGEFDLLVLIGSDRAAPAVQP